MKLNGKSKVSILNPDFHSNRLPAVAGRVGVG